MLLNIALFAFFLHLQGTSGLGFAIVEESRDGRQGIYVRSVTPGGVAAQVTIESCDGRQGIYVRSVTPGGVAAQVKALLMLLCFCLSPRPCWT